MQTEENGERMKKQYNRRGDEGAEVWENRIVGGTREYYGRRGGIETYVW